MWETAERIILTLLLLWSIYVTIVKPHVDPIANETASNIFHNTTYLGFGCARYPMPFDRSITKKEIKK